MSYTESYTLDEQTVISADLDGTLALSKRPPDAEMIKAITTWLETNRFAIISGGKYEQFKTQVVDHFSPQTHFKNLYLFPTNGASFYRYMDQKWQEVYNFTISEEDVAKIRRSIEDAVSKSGVTFGELLYGEQIEDRGAQVSFSALGQDAPLEIKSVWDPDQEKRKKIVSFLAPLIPDFTVVIGGVSTIDIVKKGIDKAYAIKKMQEYLNVDAVHILFLGDAIFPGGNDYPAESTGVSTIKVSGPEEACETIKSTTTTLRQTKI